MSRCCTLSLIIIVCGCWFVGCGHPAEEASKSNTPSAEQPPEQPSAEQSPASEPSQPRVAPEDLPSSVELTVDDWPQFRGAQRDAIVRGETRLARTWPEEGPPVLWEAKVGQGYSSPSVVGKHVFLNDYDEENNEWLVRCLSLDDGEHLWEYRVKKRIRPNHAITRSAPATDGGFVFAIDPKCELHCLDARNGNLIWKKNLSREYQSTIPAWYNGQCPLLDNGRLIVATGGRALVVALDKATGEPIWEAPNEQQHLLSHSSVMPVDIDGVHQYAYTTLKGMVGIDAASGEVLWHFPWQFNTAVATSPLYVGQGRFVLTSGYHAQTVACQVSQTDGQWQAAELAAFPPPPKGWNSEVHTPIYYRDHLYGIGKVKRGMWTCLDLEGNELWTSGRQATFEMGGYVLADGMFFVLEGKTGTLRLIDAESDEYHELAKAEILSGPDVWAPPVIVRGKLLIRDLGRLLCLDVSAEAPADVASLNTPPTK